MMDISETLAPDSAQLDSIELVGGPRTFVIESVSKGTPDQPVQVHLVGFPRPWRPGKSMRRVLAAAWGTDASKYIGRSVTLYCDPSIVFGKDKVGGTRVSHMSDLPGGKTFSTPLLIARGKSAMYTVEPLTEAVRPAEPTAEQVAVCTDPGALRAMYEATSDRDLRARMRARKAELEATDSALIPDDGPMIPGADR